VIVTVRALAVDASGNVFVTGVAGAGLRTTSGAAVPASQAPQGGPYLVKVDRTGATLYATYLTVKGARPASAPRADQSTWDTPSTPYAIAVDAAGNAYVAGQASASDFAVTPGAPDTTDNQNRDAFVVKVRADGGAIVFVARLGGSDAERATSVAVAADGSVIVGGKTATLSYRGTNAFQTAVTFNNGTPLVDRETGFVARLAADGMSWRAIAAIGTVGGNLVDGAGADPYPVAVAVDRAGMVYAAGTTYPNRTLPVTRDSPSAAYGAFVMKMAADLSRLQYSAAFGFGVATAIAVDDHGAAYIAGYERGAFAAKVVDAAVPLALTSDASPGRAGVTLTLRATLADARFEGDVSFRNESGQLGTAPLVAGSAALSVRLPPGVHRVVAQFTGSGTFANAVAELVQVIEP
jgi:hypothetical protein